MVEPRVRTERHQTLGEEIANSVSHGVALLAAVAGLPFLVAAAERRGSSSAVVGVSVFAGTVILLYLTSTLYHALPRNRVKQLFRILDHGAIYLLIAGTYTPFLLGPLRGPWGWTLLAVVWSLAAAGVLVKSFAGIRWPVASTALYIAMGWLIVVAVKPLWYGVPHGCLLWLLAGGLAYTGGVAFFAAERVRYGHLVWHVFVVTGTACHFVAVLRYAV